MTRIAAHAFVLLLCLGFAGPAPAVSDPAPAAPSTVPAGTPVVLALDERLDSENVQAGQRKGRGRRPRRARSVARMDAGAQA